MRRMVIDEDDLFPGHPHPEQVSQAPALPAPMVGGLDWRPLDQLVEFSTEGPPDRGADIVCPAIGFHELLARHGIGCIPAVHRHEVDLVQRIPPEVQDSLNRLGGHSGPVLHPTKAFLLDGRGQQAILIETRRRVVTVVDAEDLHVSTFTPLYLRTPWPTSRAPVAMYTVRPRVSRAGPSAAHDQDARSESRWLWPLLLDRPMERPGPFLHHAPGWRDPPCWWTPPVILKRTPPAQKRADCPPRRN